ncbi:85/88 kDa calcium-independent phospholipase A2 [Patella vulgata]|uniref:85/88 kDa calcium-independent phospholipase A2 n=1 Tax=Patella vulgata TaxID=6465 RepID=UPI0024A7B173|nr:85/88 kDa calcium-independent phospholipase A2 [Patella vulgata]
MAGYLKSIVGGIFNAAAANINPYKIQIANPESFKDLNIITRDDCLYLYKRPGCVECVLISTAGVSSKWYSLFRLTSEGDANALFSNLCAILLPLIVSSSSVYQEDNLQKICDNIREHPTWNVAHVAAFVGLFEAFRHPSVNKFLSTGCSVTGIGPVHAAISGQQIQCVQELLKCDASLEIADTHGNTAYHQAVKILPTVIPILMRYDHSSVVQWTNKQGETAIYTACKMNLPDATEMLLHAGADPNISSTDALPIHIAIQENNLQSAELILRDHPDQLSVVDNKYGATPLHWVKSKEAVEMLARFGCNMNAVSSHGDTALHVVMKKKLIDCVMSLLCYGTDCNILDSDEETPLHWAVQNDDIEYVRTFIVFGADVNQRNKKQHSPRHIASTSKGKNRELILYLLHIAGAKRCGVDIKGCLQGCVAEGSHNGVPNPSMKTLLKLDSVALFDDLLSARVTCEAKMEHGQGSVLDMVNAPTNAGDRILSLDGGGIRGLILIQVLMEIEHAMGKPIRECFDWIGGTSTGAILALGIAKGVSLQYMKGLYFRMKDEVFRGMRPYSSEPFEEMLKREFGSDTVMSDLKHAKVMVTGVKADTFPAQFHLFRNYINPFKMPHTGKSKINDDDILPHNQLVWKAARASGAAPTYFRCHGNFMDGGLMANNPTLDILTEINEFNKGLKMDNLDDQIRPLGCVISVGTGRLPETEVKNVDVFRPEGLFDAARSVLGLSALGNLIVDQATISEGRPVDRSRAWCSMINVPFYRFSPQLSEHVGLDCHDNKTLINMMWETQCYMVANRHRVNELTSLLCGIEQ